MSKKESKTNVYHMLQAEVCPLVTKKVPDIATGGTRNRKHAAYCSVAIINELTGHMDPIILQGEMPKFLIDGDSLSDVKDRLFAELSEVFKNAQDVLDGTVTMEELQEKAIGEATVPEPELSKIELPD